MTINLDEYNRLGKGDSAIVITIPNSKIAYKLFKSFDYKKARSLNLNNSIKEPSSKIAEFNTRRIGVFKNEIEAYSRIMDSEFLKTITPEFYGKIEIVRVLDKKKDVSNEYLLNCCFQFEPIKLLHECGFGHDRISLTQEILEQIPKFEKEFSFCYDDLKSQFNRNDICIEDSSILINEKQFKIVDFSIINR